jgi:hypothetical protein
MKDISKLRLTSRKKAEPPLQRLPPGANYHLKTLGVGLFYTTPLLIPNPLALPFIDTAIFGSPVFSLVPIKTAIPV